MERRKFIKNAILSTGLLAIPSMRMSGYEAVKESAPTVHAPHQKYRRSIMWGTVGLEGTVLEKCQAIKAAGFDGIEPNSHMDRKEVLDAMQKTGLVASSVCCSTHWEKLLSSPDASIRQEGIDGMIVALEDAKAYGTDAVLLVPGKVDESVSYDECWDRSTECIKKLVPHAEKLKVKICIENVWNNFLLSPLEACRYIDQFNSSYVGSYFDCGNILVYGWPEQWIKILGNRAFRIHIKEFSKQIADSEGRWKGFGAKLTEGDVDWKNVMKSARNSYNGGWFTTEQGSSKTLDELIDLRTRLDKVLNM
ncbi:MAG: sugar phosphate isomerase/epimerase [Tannerella sp.]|jgi:hexulose-6-phosphate isomerase|nr:sugar phosphate isomerase/epimerase [Tannerella sp.]